MKKTLSYIIKFRTLILLTILAITLVMGWQMKNLKINSDIISSLPDDDPAAVLYKEIGEKYQGSTIGIIIVNSENLYSTNDCRCRHDNRYCSKHERVESVTSLANIINIKTDEYGLEVGNLVDIYALPETEEELMNLKTKLRVMKCIMVLLFPMTVNQPLSCLH